MFQQIMSNLTLDICIVRTRSSLSAVASTWLIVLSGAMWPYSAACGQACQEQQKLTASDGAELDLFGYSVSISGDTAIVGMRPESDLGSTIGAAYVFVRSGPPGQEVWTQQQKLTASDGVDGDQFGWSVSLSGDTAIVGALYSDSPAFNSGSAYVFVRSGPPGQQIWTQQQKLFASDGSGGDLFGFSVSIDGDTAIVGAYNDDAPGIDNSGSAYVFMRSGPAGEEFWTQQQKLTASDGLGGDNFGVSVSISGDTAIVGAYLDDAPGSGNSGSAYVFVRSGPPGSQTWTQHQKLTASDGLANDNFGNSVSIDGDTAIVGAYSDDNVILNTNSGSAYVFVRSGFPGAWTQLQKLTASGFNEQFGVSVCISGATAIVGAYHDHAPALYSGSAYVFVRSGPPGEEVWTQHQQLTASDGTEGDRFGNSVSIDGDSAIVGAYTDDVAANLSGSAYVFGCDFCPADIFPLRTGDGVVDVADLLAVINAWGTCADPKNCPADVNDDGTVNVVDLLMLINSWGRC